MTVIGSNGAGKSTMMNMISGEMMTRFWTIGNRGGKCYEVKEYKRSS